ncbi:immune-associated nucleotide-binding protein 8-like isoform X4 [Parambassis ranga]|uniref:Immune-associated nucleotide-binding protein 8-like isoform X4 n=1 Tax=Parambassis ranga TaxID=210632 RepID=A0A6P7IFG1_9TELE|nr:immune-associated nucleotide-binding protein 8-like isoform X4 [Parambassis ranga]
MAVTRIALLGESLLKTGTGEREGQSDPENSILTTVVDSSFDTMPEETLKNETVKCLAQCGPGLRAVLIVLKVDRDRDQNKDIIDKILEEGGEEVLKYAIVVFTHGEELKPGETIEDFVGMSESLSALVKKCGGRCHVVDNEHWNNSDDDNYRNNKVQVTQLLNTIERMKQSGGFYTNQTKKEKSGRITRILCRLVGALEGTLLGALFGAAVCQSVRFKTRFGAGIGAVFGACIGYSAGEQASTPGEAALKTLEMVTAVGKGFMQANDALQSGGSKD